MDVWVDIETRSSLDLRAAGTFRYADCPDTEVILLGYAVDDGPVAMWELGDDPYDPMTTMAMGDRLIAHNAVFERTVMSAKDWVREAVEDWHCTMAQAYSHSLPGGLDQLCRFLGVAPEQGKIGGGQALMKLFCRRHHGKFLSPDDMPEKWAEFREYCRQDVAAMRECYRRMPKMNIG